MPFIKWNPERFPCLELTTSVDLSGTLSLSIDTPEDLARNEALITGLAERAAYHLHDILRILETLPPEAAGSGLDDTENGIRRR